jgi:hypothetical protein
VYLSEWTRVSFHLVRDIRLLYPPTLSPPQCLTQVTATGRHPSNPKTCRPLLNTDCLLALPGTGRHLLTGVRPALLNTDLLQALPSTGRHLLTGAHLALPNTVSLLTLLNTDLLLALKGRRFSLPNTGSLLAINTGHHARKRVRRRYASRTKHELMGLPPHDVMALRRHDIAKLDFGSCI